MVRSGGGGGRCGRTTTGRITSEQQPIAVSARSAASSSDPTEGLDLSRMRGGGPIGLRFQTSGQVAGGGEVLADEGDLGGSGFRALAVGESHGSHDAEDEDGHCDPENGERGGGVHGLTPTRRA